MHNVAHAISTYCLNENSPWIMKLMFKILFFEWCSKYVNIFEIAKVQNVVHNISTSCQTGHSPLIMKLTFKILFIQWYSTYVNIVERAKDA